MHMNKAELAHLEHELNPVLKNQVVVRYETIGGTQFSGDVLTFYPYEDECCLIAQVTVNATLSHTVEVKVGATLTTLDMVLKDWNQRRCNDWLNPEAFVANIPVFRDGQLCTSLKTGIDSGCWDFWSGLMAGVVNGHYDAVITNHRPDPEEIAAATALWKRFSAFTAQNQRKWAQRVMSHY